MQTKKSEFQRYYVDVIFYMAIVEKIMNVVLCQRNVIIIYICNIYDFVFLLHKNDFKPQIWSTLM